MTGWTTGIFGGTAGLKSDGSLCVANAANSDGYWNAADTSSADSEIWWTINANNNNNESQSGTVRTVQIGSGTTDGYHMRLQHRFGSTGRFFLSRIDDGVLTNINNTNVQALSAGDSVGLVIAGSTLQIWYRASGGSWAQKGTDYTDATHGAAGKLGLVITATGTSIGITEVGGGPFAAGGTAVKDLIGMGLIPFPR